MKRGVVLLAAVGLFAAQQVLVVPGDSRLAEAVHDVMHVPWFAVLTGLFVCLSGWRVGFGVAVLVALASELLQMWTGREPSVADLARNALGMALAGGVVLMRGGRLLLGSVVAGVVVVLAGWGVAEALVERQQANDSFPVLLDARTRENVYFLEATTPMSVERSGVRVDITDVAWPGVHITEPVSDWRRYDVLELDVTAAEPLQLTVGLRLTPTGGSTTYQTLALKSGRHRYAVPLGVLLPEPAAAVHDVFVYSSPEHAGQQFTLHRVVLTECGSSGPGRSCPGLR